VRRHPDPSFGTEGRGVALFVLHKRGKSGLQHGRELAMLPCEGTGGQGRDLHPPRPPVPGTLPQVGQHHKLPCALLKLFFGGLVDGAALDDCLYGLNLCKCRSNSAISTRRLQIRMQVQVKLSYFDKKASNQNAYAWLAVHLHV